MTILLKVKDIVKNYGKIEAVRGVSFEVEKGQCFGLLGPNGAGKTTIIEVIEDVIPATSGEILYNGKTRSSDFHEKVGIQFQQTAVLGHMTIGETLKTFQALYQHTADIEYLADLCFLNDFLDQMNDKISGGQRQRFFLALALINEPELIFLDEPSTGLDPQARRNLWDIVRKITKIGKTIILTTHYMEEAQYLCDEVAIMDNGKIIAEGSPEDLIKAHGGVVTIVIPEENFQDIEDKEKFRHTLKGDVVEISTNDTNDCLKDLLKQNVNLNDMVIRSQNLESVFLNLTGRKLRE